MIIIYLLYKSLLRQIVFVNSYLYHHSCNTLAMWIVPYISILVILLVLSETPDNLMITMIPYMTPCLIEVERLFLHSPHDPELSHLTGHIGITFFATVTLICRITKAVAMWTQSFPFTQCLCTTIKALQFTAEAVVIHIILRLCCDSSNPMVSLAITLACGCIMIIVYKFLVRHRPRHQKFYTKLSILVVAVLAFWTLWLTLVHVLALYKANPFQVTLVNTFTGALLFLLFSCLICTYKPSIETAISTTSSHTEQVATTVLTSIKPVDPLPKTVTMQVTPNV